jgi:hypothetical protein
MLLVELTRPDKAKTTINLSNVNTMYRDLSGTHIDMVGGTTLTVLETPEEIERLTAPYRRG